MIIIVHNSTHRDDQSGTSSPHILVLLFQNRDSRRSLYYSDQSIIGDVILCELLLSVLLLVSRLEFRLEIESSIFLDETWTIPASVSLQLVPSRTLGVTVM